MYSRSSAPKPVASSWKPGLMSPYFKMPMNRVPSSAPGNEVTPPMTTMINNIRLRSGANAAVLMVPSW